MSEHDTHDYEHVWPPYGVQLAMLKPTACVWSESDGGEYWATSCGELHVLNVGTPQENSYRFCPYCGKPLSQVRSLEAAEAADAA